MSATKLIALGISAVLLAAIAIPNTLSYTSYEDESRAARIQQKIMDDAKRNNDSYKISDIRRRIADNEAQIKKLESKRSNLDHELAVQLQNREICSWWDSFSIDSKINDIQYQIKSNEKEIERLKRKRSDLDHELAVQLQNQEVWY